MKFLSATRLLFAAILAASSGASAADYAWDGGDTNDSLWGSLSNWAGDPSSPPVTGDSLFFSGQVRTITTNNLPADTFFTDVEFSNPINTNFSLNGNRFGVTGDIISRNGSGNFVYSINADPYRFFTGVYKQLS